jgi:hypothetical protein
MKMPKTHQFNENQYNEVSAQLEMTSDAKLFKKLQVL